MCRFVVVVIFISCVSFGAIAQKLKTEVGTNKTKEEVMVKNRNVSAEENKTLCRDKPELQIKRQEMRNCFNRTVQLHLNPPANKTEGCQHPADFGKILNDYVQLLNTECNHKYSINTTNLIKFIEFSLREDYFKQFNIDLACVIKQEYYISNTCVKAKMGYFNITKAKKHTGWYPKANLHYNRASCDASIKVGNCVLDSLDSCEKATKDYVSSLFNYSRQLGNCDQFPKTALPQPGATPVSGSWLSLPVIIILSLGVVVLVVAIIVIIVLKCKYKYS